MTTAAKRHQGSQQSCPSSSRSDHGGAHDRRAVTLRAAVYCRCCGSCAGPPASCAECCVGPCWRWSPACSRDGDEQDPCAHNRRRCHHARPRPGGRGMQEPARPGVHPAQRGAPPDRRSAGAAGQDFGRVRSRRHGRHRRGVGGVRSRRRPGGGHHREHFRGAVRAGAEPWLRRRATRAPGLPDCFARLPQARPRPPGPRGGEHQPQGAAPLLRPGSRHGRRFATSGPRPRLAPAKDRCRVDGLVSRAELADRETQILQAPHIERPTRRR